MIYFLFNSHLGIRGGWVGCDLGLQVSHPPVKVFAEESEVGGAEAKHVERCQLVARILSACEKGARGEGVSEK